jgi:hypothetical protein
VLWRFPHTTGPSWRQSQILIPQLTADTFLHVWQMDSAGVCIMSEKRLAQLVFPKWYLLNWISSVSNQTTFKRSRSQSLIHS